MASLFSRIVKGEIPCHKIAETEDYLAFLDIMPLATGHVLVIPKQEVDYIFDLEDDAFMGLHLFSKVVAEAVKQAIPCIKVGVAVVGLEVPHAHIHLVPLNEIGDINFSKEKLKPTLAELTETAARIRNFIPGN
jgi:histidine triad (HIT) family protein